VDRGEPVEDAIRREVREEAGLDIEVGGLVGVYSAAGNPVVVIAFAAEPRTYRLVETDDLTDLRGFPLDHLPDLAFDHDRRIIQDWLALRERLAGSAEPTGDQGR